MFQSALFREDAKAKKGEAFEYGAWLCMRMNRQTQARQTRPNGLLPFREHLLVFSKEQKIVHIAQIGFAAQSPLHKMVKWIHINIRPKLAG